MGRTKELLEMMQNKTTEEFINNKFLYETLDISEDYDNRVLE